MSKFTNYQYDEIYPDNYFSHYWCQARKNILINELGKLSFPGTVLDVGCGRVFEGASFCEAGDSAEGVEVSSPEPYSPEIRDYLHLGQNSLELSQETRDKVGLLTFLDVIEHIEDPKGFLEQHIELYPNVKYILITVPARQEIFSNYDEFNGHFLRYDLEQIEGLLSSYEIVELGYFCHLLYFPAAALKMLNIKRKVGLNPPGGSGRINDLLAKVLYLDYKLLPKKMYGSSALAVFKIGS